MMHSISASPFSDALALDLWYDFHEYEWHLGNGGSQRCSRPYAVKTNVTEGTMKNLFSSVSALVAIAFAAALPVPAAAADVNMAGVAYIIFSITQDKNTDFHTKGIGEGKGVYLPEDGANPLANGTADFDLVFHSAKREDIEYLQRTGAYGEVIISDAEKDYLILGYVRHPGEQVKWIANGGSGKYANASGNGDMVIKPLPTGVFKFTFSGTITID